MMGGDELSALAGALLNIRRMRSAHFPPMMLKGEQIWDLVLILFIADGRGERLSGRQAIARDGGSEATGRRWIRYLTASGHIVGDGDGNLDDVLSMTPHGLDAVEAWLRDAKDQLPSDRGLSIGIA